MNNKALFKNISFFTLFNIIEKGIPFLLLPILTSYLSPEDYGIVDIFYNISLIITPIIGLSTVQSITRYFFEKINLIRYVNTVVLILFITGSIIIGLFILFYFIGGDFLHTYEIPPLIIIMAFIYTLFSQLSEVILTLWRVTYKTISFGTFRVVKTLLDISSSLLLIVVFKMGWEGRLIPQLGITILFGVLAFFFLRNRGYLIKPKMDILYRKKALSFSLPLIFHTLGGHLIGFSDRFFILFMLGLNNVGIYSVGYQIGMVIALLQNSFNQAWVPFFFQKLKENSQKTNKKIVKITYIYFLLILLLVVFFNIITPFIYKFFIGNEFKESIGVVFWVLLGYAFNGMYKMVANYLFYLKKTKAIAICTISFAILNMVLNYILIKSYGLIGAAQATAITFLGLFIVVFIITYNNYKMPWLLKKEI